MNVVPKPKSKKCQLDDCKIIGQHLELEKTEVFEYLYQRIVQENRLDKALSGDADTIYLLKNSDDYLRARQAQADRVQRESERTNRVRAYRPSQGKDDLAETPDEQIRCAMWLIRKIGDPEKAKIALDIAIQAYTKLQKATGK